MFLLKLLKRIAHFFGKCNYSNPVSIEWEMPGVTKETCTICDNTRINYPPLHPKNTKKSSQNSLTGEKPSKKSKYQPDIDFIYKTNSSNNNDYFSDDITSRRSSCNGFNSDSKAENPNTDSGSSFSDGGSASCD